MSASDEKTSLQAAEPILVTGAAGFIGSHMAEHLLQAGSHVIGLDHFAEGEEHGKLKEARLSRLRTHSRFTFHDLNLALFDETIRLFREAAPRLVLHMAARTGIRDSLKNPYASTESNLLGFLNVLEGCRLTGAGNLVFASSSSVYGENSRTPFRVSNRTDFPLNAYAASKKSNEVMAHAYSHLYGLRCTGLRFFTVYGPWGRPDMAPFLFTKALLKGETIRLYNEGRSRRDFTYIDDVLEGSMIALREHFDRKENFRLYNVGSSHSIAILEMLRYLEQEWDREAKILLLPELAGEMRETAADIGDLSQAGFRPKVSLREGIQRFVAWYRSFYEIR